MLKMKSLVVAAALCLCLFGGATGNAQGKDEGHPECYTLASLKGTYAVVTTYGSHVGIALGLRHFDGNGNVKSTFTVNAPASNGGRRIITGTSVGTYSVNCDGSGVITRILTASNGTKTTQANDFLITRAIVRDGQFLATALQDAQRTPSAIVPGTFVTRSYTRRPDEPHGQDSAEP
jgi:hypothetical protein